ncbi:MAG: DsrE family protein [Rubritepida sp.]|nr:DsrE family protein [Rubritepida sp.]
MTPLGVLLISGGHERAHYALMVASAAAAIGRDVTLFAANAGCALWLEEAPLAADAREGALAAAGVATLAELLEAVTAMGVRRIACEAGLRAAGLAGQPLAPGVEVAGLVTFLAAVGSGQVVTL